MPGSRIPYNLFLKKNLHLLHSVSVITLSYLDQCKVYLALSVSMQEWFQKQLTVAEISQFLSLSVNLSLFFPPGTEYPVHGCTSIGRLALPELKKRNIHRQLFCTVLILQQLKIIRTLGSHLNRVETYQSRSDQTRPDKMILFGILVTIKCW
jgi:hypothetical protein